MKEENQKKITGRKALSSEMKREPIKVFLNSSELLKLTQRIGESNLKRSEYIRSVLLDDAKKPSHSNPADFLNDVSNLAREVNKLGVNINQISKYVNQLILMERVEPHIAETFNEQLNDYALLQAKIEDKLKEIMFI